MQSMKINLVLFVTTAKEENGTGETLIKEFKSDFRPVNGDIIDDPGFHPAFHNGYEVVKVTVNYATNECFVSLTPLAIEVEEIALEEYLEHLQANGWHVFSKEEWSK